jgi:hypothetical protein
MASIKFTLPVKHGSSELYHGIKSDGTHTNIYIEK